MQINDAMFTYFREQGYAGALPDMRYAWLRAEGYTSMLDAMISNGYTSGSLADFMLDYFNSNLNPFTQTTMSQLITAQAGVPGGSWNFNDLSTMFSDPDGLNPISVDDPIAVVKDISGKGHDLIQPVFALRPTLQLDSFTGRYAAVFDGSDDYFYVDGLEFDSTNEFSIAIAAQKATTDNDRHLLNIGGTTAPFVILQSSSDEWRFRVDTNTGNPKNISGYGAGSRSALVGIFDLGNQKLRLRVDGTEPLGDGATASTGNVATGRMTVGSNTTGGNRFNGRMFEVSITGRVYDSSDLTAVESYMAGLLAEDV